MLRSHFEVSHAEVSHGGEEVRRRPPATQLLGASGVSVARRRAHLRVVQYSRVSACVLA